MAAIARPIAAKSPIADTSNTIQANTIRANTIRANTIQANTTVVPKNNKTLLSNFVYGIGHFVSYFWKFIIFGPVEFQLSIAFSIVILGSILNAYDLAPASYFSLKSNIFNQYFVKLGWGWTIGLLTIFILLSSFKARNCFAILKSYLVRICIATCIWYGVTNLFILIELQTGTCRNNEIQVSLKKKICLREGYKWSDGFDLSGHAFLLLYSILIINEEVRPSALTSTMDQPNNQETKSDSDASNSAHKFCTYYSKLIQMFHIALKVLTFLWQFMLLSTALYFHEFWHKFYAALVATVFWFITYRVLYAWGNSWISRPMPFENGSSSCQKLT